MPLRLWPQGLIGRVILVLMCAVLVEFVGGSIVYEFVELRAARSEQAQAVAEQLVVAKRALWATPRPERDATARELTTENVTVQWRSTGGDGLTAVPDKGLLADIQAEMLEWEPALAGHDLRLAVDGGRRLGEPVRLKGSLQLPDGSRILVSSVADASPMTLMVAAFTSAAVLSFGVLIAGVMMLRSLGAPLRALALAADSVGRGAPVRVREEGAGDLRRVAHAFNAMQTRIGELITTRTRALAAVGHDLRTPLARLRLRAGMVEDDATREALEGDVDEMSAMLESLLAYLSGASESEPQKLTDLAAVCMTLVDSASDAGQNAAYTGPDSLRIRLRVSAVRRAIDNLLHNALNYGGAARVDLSTEGEIVIIRVDDDGPGIPEEEMERLRQPFERRDNARTRNTNGLGLGLSIVEQTATQQGGEFRLENRPEGGLRAELRLPLQL